MICDVYPLLQFSDKVSVYLYFNLLQGLPCKKGRDCFCKPCVKAFEVDVYTYEEGAEDFHLDGTFQNELSIHRGCSKMSLCGTVQQTRKITFRAYDNLKRENPAVRIRVHVGDE